MSRINLLLLSLLILGTTMAQNMANRYQAISKIDKAECADNVNKTPIDGPKAMWDIVWNSQANRADQTCIETDGSHIYCPAWATDTITPYDMDGANATNFTIEGVSAGAGLVEATIDGGVERDLLIIEIATGTWCVNCPGAAMAVDEMHAEGLSVGVIEYHSGDSFETTETDARIDYYDVPGFPTAQFDGVNAIVGGNATQSMYPTYLPVYEQQIAKPALFEIVATYKNNGGENYQISVDAEMIEEYPWLSNDLVLQVALTESHIPEFWQNQTEVNFVCRDMIPNANGTSLDFAGNLMQSVVLDFTIPASYAMQNIELIVFIQDNTTKEILQGSESMFVTGLENIVDENRINVFPNPATDYLNISASMDIRSITIYNQVGQLVFAGKTDSKTYTLNTANYLAGLYFIQLETEKGMISKRVVIE